MKKNILLIGMLITTVAFTACTSGKEAVQASSEINAAVPAVTEGVAGNLSGRLYPAYVMEGSDKKWGYIDGSGAFVIKPQYESAGDFMGSGMAEISENGAWRLIDLAGKLVMESEYLYSTDFTGQGTVVTDGSGKSYLYNKNGAVIFQTDGTIDKPSCGMSAFSKRVDNEKDLWGYINTEGKVVIEPVYEWAQAFSGDKALVKIKEGSFGLIDKEGKLLKEIDTKMVKELSEDAFVFTRTSSEGRDKYGYMTLDGEILLDAAYSEAQGFTDGLAIVNTAGDYENKYGVINKNGEFVIPAEYGEITYIGDGIYSVSETHEAYYFSDFAKKALFDKTGKQLTGFDFYNVGALENGLISVSDEKSTYLIDSTGEEIKSLPRVEGIGSIRLNGGLYRIEADNVLQYYSQEGKKLWVSDNTIRFDNGLEVSMKSFRPDRCMLIQYPEVAGLADLKVQEGINGMLKEYFVGDSKGSNKEGNIYTDSIEIGFTAEKNKDMLIITKNGYYYPIGAAHGQPSREEYHINIRTGKLYTLKDLFKADSNYKSRLTEIVKGKIDRANKELGEQLYSEDIGDLETDGGFTFRSDALRIYFYPYAIASYAAGFPEFSISYDELKDLIDTDGELWNSFERAAQPKDKGKTDEFYDGDRVKIEEAINAYETTMVEAINKNTFSVVEPWLYPDSSLYISQKKLVGELNKKQIKERLDGYSIESIEGDNLGIIRVYVTENIGIQYPGKDYTNKTFKWVYSVRYSYEGRKYQLTYIDKWE